VPPSKGAKRSKKKKKPRDTKGNPFASESDRDLPHSNHSQTIDKQSNERSSTFENHTKVIIGSALAREVSSVRSGDGEEEEVPLDELDREVEEFRLRLEAAKNISPPGHTRQKVNFVPQNWNT